MSKVFFISDTHFLHENIIKYTGRPLNHNKLMVENWNNTVSKDDYVFHIGDFSAGVNKVPQGFEKLKKIANMLNGTKYLIKGNHDHYSDDVYTKELGFESVNDYIIYKDYFLCHYSLNIDKYTENRHIESFEKLNQIFMKSNAKFIVHGHSHTTKFEGKINVSVEQINFTPIQEENLLSIL